MADDDIRSGGGIGEPAGDFSPGGAAAAAGSQRSRTRRGSRDPKVFVLDRELSEVHLLLDNVSANPSTTLSERLTETHAADDLEDDWIEQICRISWPPDGSNDDKAEDAALLIKAKDHLNRLSHPASGSTIAFTLLVTQEEARQQRRPAADEPEQRSPTRNSLAQTAYPDLMPKAIRFRKAMRGISIGLVVALFVTCLLSWYVAYGNAALAELGTTQTVLADATKRVNDAEAAEDDQGGGGLAVAAGSGAAKEAAGTEPALAAEPGRASGGKFIPYCDRGFYSSAAQAQACAARVEAQDNHDRVKRRLAGWVCVVSWSCLQDLSRYEDLVAPKPGVRLTRDQETAAAQVAGEIREGRKAAVHNQELIANAPSRAAALANIMGTAVLPFLYGLLGAGAAIIRSLSRKIRASLLSPRDLHLSFQQLALGAVVGACIGLFVAAPGGGDGEGLLGPVTLSASAISFVAGFGVDSVFEALETLIKRIFNVAQPAAGNRGDGVPAS